MSAHNVEGPQGATTAKDKCRATKGMAGLAQEAQLVLQGHIGALIVGESLQVVLHLLYVFPDLLWHHWVVLVQLAAMTAEQQFSQVPFNVSTPILSPGTEKYHSKDLRGL